MAQAPGQVVDGMAARGAHVIMGCIRSFGQAARRYVSNDSVHHTLAASIGIIVVAPLLFMLLDRGQILVYENQRIVPDPVARGTRAASVIDAVELRKCDGYMQRVIIDSSGHTFSFTKETTNYREVSDPPRMRTLYREFVVPRGAAAGPAVHRVHLVRWCNVVQKLIWPIRETARDVHFVILDRPGSS